MIHSALKFQDAGLGPFTKVGNDIPLSLTDGIVEGTGKRDAKLYVTEVTRYGFCPILTYSIVVRGKAVTSGRAMWTGLNSCSILDQLEADFRIFARTS